MKRTYYFVCLSLGLFTSLYSQASTIRFNNLTVGDGLSQNTVEQIIQDRQGFLWFGTKDGLNKYNGYTFEIIKHSPDNANSISDNYITTLHEDSKGYIWIGTANGGLNRYDPLTDMFEQYPTTEDGTGSLTSDNITDVVETADYHLWIGTDQGLNELDLISGKVTQYYSDPEDENSLCDNAINKLFVDKKGIIWIGTNTKGLCTLNPWRKTFKRYPFGLNTNKASDSYRVQDIYQDSFGTIWFATKQGLVKYIHESNQFEILLLNKSLDNNECLSLAEDNDSNLWVGTLTQGVYRISLLTDERTQFAENPKNLGNIILSGVLELHKDEEGSFWAGMNGTGIIHFDPNPVFKYVTKRDDDQGISEKSVRAFLVDADSSFWVGSYGGLDYFNRKHNQHKRYYYNPPDPVSLPSNNVYSLLQDNQLNLWIGTEGTGLVILNRDKNHMENVRSKSGGDPTALPGDFIFCMEKDDQDNIWLGTDNGLARYHQTDNSDFYFKTYFRQNGNSIKAIEASENHMVWVGTEKSGLILLNAKTDEYTAFKHDLTDPKSIRSNNILSLYEDSTGTLWIGTHGGGLNRYDKSAGTFTSFTTADGMSNDIIYGILPDDDNNLWLSTNKGLSVLSLDDYFIRNYDVHDGLQSNEFNTGAHYKSPSGQMYFGGISGITIFNPKEVLAIKRDPKVLITDFQIFNESVAPTTFDANTGMRDISFKDKLAIKYSDRVISFEFAGLYYRNPEKITYAYQLEGVNTDWVVSPASKRFVSYTNLEAGHYVFRVRAFIDKKLTDAEETSLDIIVRAAPWKTPTAYVLYIAGTLLLFYFIRLYELKRIELRNQLREERIEVKKREEVDKAKSEFFANISHEFRTPLTLIKGRLTDIKNVLSSSQQKNLEKHFVVTSRNIDRLEELMNQLLELSKLEAGTLKLKAQARDFSKFLKRVKSAFDSVTDQKGIHLGLILPEDPVGLYFDDIKMERVINNLLSNAIEFTPSDGSITCRLTNEDGGDLKGFGSFAVLEITDTGEGIPSESLDKIFDRFYQADTTITRSHEGTGIGLALVKELTELHGGTVSVESKVGKGTTFTIRLPKGAEHLLAEELVESDGDIVSEEITTEATNKTFQVQKGIEHAINILIVEDNQDMADYINDQLTETYNTDIAYDGEAGLQRAIDGLPDLIISDVMMPKKDGYALAKDIRNNEVLSHVPIILLTAKAGKDDRIAGHKSLADAYVTKPFQPDELLAQVSNLLESRRRLYRKFSETWMVKTQTNALEGPDQTFMEKVQKSITSRLDDSSFTVDDLARATYLSRRQLERRLVDLAGLTPGQLIRKTRLHHAKQLLSTNALLSVTEAAQRIGFEDTKYFSRLFQKEFNISPSEIISRQG